MNELEKFKKTSNEFAESSFPMTGGGGFEWTIFEDGTTSTEVWETGRSVEMHIKENFALRKITKNLWGSIKYYEDYNSHLLGLTTKNEFRDQIKSHATFYDKTSEEELVYLTHVCVNVIESNLTSGELSQMTNSDPAQIDTVLSKNSMFTMIND